MSDIEAVPDLYRLAFIPGNFRCPKCGFGLSKNCINAETGEIGTREQERESEPCPNDGTMMVHVSYRERLEEYAKWLGEERARFDSHTKAVGDFLSELYAIMVDPLADGTMTVDETMRALRKAALRDRELEHATMQCGARQ